ncbi:MAG: DegV family protein [Bacillota bacterium]
MAYKIVVDSCCEYEDIIGEQSNVAKIPFSMLLEGETIVDDKSFDQMEFIRKTDESDECPKSACPSPQDFCDAYVGEAQDIYVVTISAALSGCHNSAELGKKMFAEDVSADKNIHVFDTKSASVGEVLVMLKIRELAEVGMAFAEIVEKVESFIEEMGTYFVLESLETLRKNGRLSKTKAILANVLNIKPIMCATAEGEIEKLEQSRGINKALSRMADIVVGSTSNMKDKILGITHCNAHQRALDLKAKFEKIGDFKEIIIVKAAGLSTMYANNGGIIVCV